MATKKKKSSKSRVRGSSLISNAKGRGTKAQVRQENREVAGLILLALGILLAIAVYTTTTGAFGQFFDNLTGRFIGTARYVVPPIALFFGWQLLRMGGRKRKRRQYYPSEVLAWSAAGIALFSFLDIIGGRPVWSSAVEELSGAGGWLGVFTGGTLDRYFGNIGQLVVTLTLAIIAGVLLTSVSVGEWADALAERLEPVKERLNHIFRRAGFEEYEDEPEEELAPRARRKYKKVFEASEDEEDGDDYIDLRAPGALQDESSWGEDAPEPVIEVPNSVVVENPSIAYMEPVDGQWHLPSLDLLDRTEVQDVDRASVEQTGRQLEHALTEHGVETRLVGVVVGPTVSRFELELGPGVKVQKVISLHKDIAYAMATPDVRILAPIPGKQAIGVEVPNVRRQIVTVGDLLVSEEASRATHPLEVALGRDINGKTVMAHLAEMPHLLVAGQTGSGKSSCINSLLTSILMRSTPDQVRLILVDPKRVELTQYRGLPHLLTDVVTDPKKAANALAWAVREMERRYDLLSEQGVRDLKGYNEAIDDGLIESWYDGDGNIVEPQRMGYILVVLDELADLMMVAARDVEESICRIAQKARAVGVHLIIATQRPSTNVITGLIKANVPARLAFAVSSLTDSRVILDQAGAERLVGQGDALLSDGRTSTARRYQGAWVTETEVSTVVQHWIDQSPELLYDTRIIGEDKLVGAAGGLPGGTTGNEEDDELMVKAIDLVVKSGLGSTSMLQRKLRIGFARAGRLMDLLEERGIVGPSIGSKAREVMMSPEELAAGQYPAQVEVAAPIVDQSATMNRRVVRQQRAAQEQPVVPEKRERRRTLADIQNPEPTQGRKVHVASSLPDSMIAEAEPDELVVTDEVLNIRPADDIEITDIEIVEDSDAEEELADDEEWVYEDEEEEEEEEEEEDEDEEELADDEEWVYEDDEVEEEEEDDEEEDDDEEYDDDDDDELDEEDILFDTNSSGPDPALAPPPGY